MPIWGVILIALLVLSAIASLFVLASVKAAGRKPDGE